MTRIIVYPADKGACGHFRMTWPAAAMQAQGLDVVLHEPGPMDDVPVQVGLNTAAVPIARMTGEPDFDVLVIQRPTSWRATPAILMLREAGVRVVVDLDDDLSCVSAQHSGFRGLHPPTSPMTNWHHLMAACRAADAVIVTTPALAKRYGGQGHAIVVPNCVPEAWLGHERTREDERTLIGWTGAVSTHPGDLDVTRGAVQRAMSATGADFRVIGAHQGVKEALKLDAEPDFVEGVALSDYTPQVAQLDIGIAPLNDTAFNAAKSHLKPLDYCAAGVPFVCTDSVEYRRFCAQGVGNVAQRPREWEGTLKRLARDEVLRKEQAEAGREVAKKWTIEGNVDRWVEAWTGT